MRKKNICDCHENEISTSRIQEKMCFPKLVPLIRLSISHAGLRRYPTSNENYRAIMKRQLYSWALIGQSVYTRYLDILSLK